MLLYDGAWIHGNGTGSDPAGRSNRSRRRTHNALDIAAAADGDGYRLVTHVCVHGMMYGDYWPENEEDLEPIILV